ncbi:hypothetical protein ACFL0Y_03480 [Patescibacteria group bacterium]
MSKQLKLPLQIFGLMTNFLGLSAFFHNFFADLFAIDERFFSSLAYILALTLPLPLIYIGGILTFKLVKKPKKGFWQRIFS